MDRKRLYDGLMRSYPRRYRERRADEIVSTIMDSSERGGGLMRDGLEVVGHGLRMRLGLTSDRFGGQVLGFAALPGLLMAGAFALALFVYGEWLPWVTHPAGGTSPHRFGPFISIGPVLYAGWIVGVSLAVVSPRRQRPVAAVCAIATLATGIFVGHESRPNGVFLVLLCACAMPCLLSPPDGRSSDRRDRQRAAVCAAVVLVLFTALELSFAAVPHSWPSIYWGLVANLVYWVPFVVAAPGFVALLALLATGRRVAAGALVVLMLPWLVIPAMQALRFPGAVLIVHRGDSGLVCLAMAAALLAGPLVLWLQDVHASSQAPV